jgi:beta-glucosidase
MPGPTRWRTDALTHAINSNKLGPWVLDERVRNILNLVRLCQKSGIPESQEEIVRDTPEDRKLLRRAAAESIVLLKNEGGILPFKKDKKVRLHSAKT